MKATCFKKSYDGNIFRYKIYGLTFVIFVINDLPYQ